LTTSFVTTPYISTTSFVTTSISPTSTYTVTPTPSTSIGCPACYHKGSFYKVGEKWQDKCTNLTCLEVVNPCYPNKTSTQIEAKEPVCQACPKGYVAKPNNAKCCPDCVPTKNIPEVCKVSNAGLQTLQQKSTDHGLCTSTKQYKVTGCGGICGSSVMASVGEDMFSTKCSCCQPTSVKKYNVTLQCADKTAMKTTFYEVLSCSCQKTTCTSSFNNAKVKVEGQNVKRSLFDSIDDIQDMDDETLQIKRRSLLNDLALIHAKKKK